ncbi:MAG: SDR family oxidoreductase [Paracoccaceae bacterium]
MGEWCLVTGATGGIGRELARLAAAEGFDLVLSARGVGRLEALAEELRGSGRQVVCIAADLAREGEAARLWAEAGAGRDIAVLVNNAGLGAHGPIQDPALAEAQQRVIAVNAVAAGELMRLAAVEMAAKGRGRILNVASSAAFMPGPGMAGYHATKVFLLYLSEAAGADLKGSGVTVTALCPGPVATGFFDQAELRGALALRLLPLAQPDAVARAGWRGMMRGKRMVVPGVLYKLVAFLMRLTPRGMALAVTRLYWSK